MGEPTSGACRVAQILRVRVLTLLCVALVLSLIISIAMCFCNYIR